MAALGGGEAAGPALPALERRKAAPGPAMLTPAFLGSCFCLGSRPDMRWCWPRAQGSQGSAFGSYQRRLMCPSCEQGGRCQLQEGPAPRWVPVFSAGDVLQLPLPLRGVGLLPGPGAAAARGRGWHPAHVHSQGRAWGTHSSTSRSATCSVTLMEDLLCVRCCVRPWRDALGTEHGPCPQGPKERDITLIWVKSEEASGRR